MSELLPCPFCGEPPAVEKCGDGDKATMIECMTAGCLGPHTSYYGVGVAAAVWNRRRVSAPVTREQEPAQDDSLQAKPPEAT